MPTSTNVGKTDLALAAASNGTFARASAPGAVAFAAVATADIAGLDADLAAKADDTAVVKLTGDQDAAGVKTWTDFHVHDLDANPTSFIDKVVLPANSPDVTWNRTVVVTHVDELTGIGNPVGSLGFNWGGQGAVDTSLPWFRDGWEYHYTVEVSPGVVETWMERHVGSYSNPNTQGDIRPFSIQVIWETWKNQIISQTSGLTLANEGGTLQWAQFARTDDENVYFKVCGKDSSDVLGYAFSLISDAVSPRDLVTIGRKAANNNALVIQGMASTSIKLTTNEVTNQVNNDGGFSFIAAAGQLMFHRTDDFIVCSRDTVRRAFRAQDNGGEFLVGFYGVTPVTRRSGELTTGLVDLGLFSSVTIAQSSVTNLTTDLAAKAPIASPTFTGTVTLPALHATGPVYGDSGTAVDGATVPIDMAIRNDWELTLGGNRTLSFSNFQSNQKFDLIVAQSTGGHTLNFGLTITWTGGSAPTLSTGAGKRDHFIIRRRGSEYLGYILAQNF